MILVINRGLRYLDLFASSSVQNAPEESCPHGAFVCLKFTTSRLLLLRPRA